MEKKDPCPQYKAFYGLAQPNQPLSSFHTLTGPAVHGCKLLTQLLTPLPTSLPLNFPDRVYQDTFSESALASVSCLLSPTSPSKASLLH